MFLRNFIAGDSTGKTLARFPRLSSNVQDTGCIMGLTQFIRANRWYDTAILIVFILAFTGAAYNHIADMVRGGLFPYAKWYGVPDVFNWYWTSLTLLDPFAMVALLFNIRFGYVVALCIMLTDVPINVYVNAHYWMIPFFKNNALMAQSAFLMFLLLTVRRIWRLSGSHVFEPSNPAL